MQDGFLGIGAFGVVGKAFVLLFVSDKPVYQLTFFFWRTVLHNSPIGFLYASNTKHFVQTRKSLACFGKYDNSTHRTVQTMGNSNKDISGLVVFLLKPFLHYLGQWLIARFVSLNDFAASFVDCYYMIVFVNYVH